MPNPPSGPLPKHDWGPGPWQDEPDHFRWQHAGLECYIFRHSEVTGSLNGYVAVPPDHPWWGKPYNECVATPACDPAPRIDWTNMPGGFPIPPPSVLDKMSSEPSWSCDHRLDSLIEVHGGITYAGQMTAIADNDDDTDVFSWGFGFDTCHAGDVTPAMDALLRQIYLALPGGAAEWALHERVMNSGWFANTYKDLAYVKRETEQLAEQLSIVKGLGWQALDAIPDPNDDVPPQSSATQRMYA